MPVSYNIIFGIAAFVLLYGSVLMAVARPTAILSELPDFLFIMSIWYTPRLFDKSNMADSYFDWFTPGLTKEDIDKIYAKAKSQSESQM